MDCSEIRDILDAYAISATSPEENDFVETHVAECIRCWDELTKAQRTAALLALSSPIEEAPEHLEKKIMAEARRDLAGIRQERRTPLFERLRFGWSTAAAGLGAASIAALAFAGFLQAQVNDLRDENDSLQASMAEANLELQRRDARLETVAQMADSLISIAGDPTSVEMAPVGNADEGMAVTYSWSKDHRSGVLVCQDVPPPPEGKVYQIWFSAANSRYAAGSFTPKDGECLEAIEVPDDWRDPTGIGLSIEDPEGVADQPQDGWLAYAYLP